MLKNSPAQAIGILDAPGSRGTGNAVKSSWRDWNLGRKQQVAAQEVVGKAASLDPHEQILAKRTQRRVSVCVDVSNCQRVDHTDRTVWSVY